MKITHQENIEFVKTQNEKMFLLHSNLPFPNVVLNKVEEPLMDEEYPETIILDFVSDDDDQRSYDLLVEIPSRHAQTKTLIIPKSGDGSSHFKSKYYEVHNVIR